MRTERFRRAALWVGICVWVPSISAGAPPRPAAWAVASAHPAATEAAMFIAEKGGNAFDAAVGVTAALAVVEPMGSGMGGGGFWLLHRARDGLQIMVDGRERAPLAAREDMYLDAGGQLVEGASLNGPLAAAIPGEPAAIVHIAEKYGRLPLAESLAPAIRLAEQGFRTGERFRRLVEWRQSAFNGAAKAVFMPEGVVPSAGTVLRQPQLADTLREIAVRGRNGFYGGWVASTLVSEVASAGGIWTQRDLSEYRVVERPPVEFDYGGAKVISASLPSSGGIVLAQILNMLEALPAAAGSRDRHVHLVVEAMRRAYRDRALHLGDGDFVEVDQRMLLSPAYARRLSADISDVATPSEDLATSASSLRAGENTSHFSIIDDLGNRVAATLSINYPFGSGFLSRGTGIILNNEMDDFAGKPGAPNAYGLVGGKANAIEPGKRPLSSMSPTFVEGDDFVAVIGTPGGSRIISMVLLALLELIDGGERDIGKVVNLPRYHHQYLPDVITYEPGAFAPELARDLESRGHRLKMRDRTYGDMHAVLWDLRGGAVSAASDRRGEGRAQVGR